MIKRTNSEVENTIQKFNDMEYLSKKTRYVDFISNKTNIVHEKLYVAALDKCIEDLVKESGMSVEDYCKSHVFIEIKNTEYWMPSKVTIKNINPPYDIKKVDLKKYWNEYQYIDEFKELDGMFFENDFDKNAFEVVDINYINGKAKFKNKYSGEEIWKDFKYLNEDTVYNKEALSLEDTFTYKLQNKIYGR